MLLLGAVHGGSGVCLDRDCTQFAYTMQQQVLYNVAFVVGLANDAQHMLQKVAILEFDAVHALPTPRLTLPYLGTLR